MTRVTTIYDGRLSKPLGIIETGSKRGWLAILADDGTWTAIVDPVRMETEPANCHWVIKGPGNHVQCIKCLMTFPFKLDEDAAACANRVQRHDCVALLEASQ